MSSINPGIRVYQTTPIYRYNRYTIRSVLTTHGTQCGDLPDLDYIPASKGRLTQHPYYRVPGMERKHLEATQNMHNTVRNIHELYRIIQKYVHILLETIPWLLYICDRLYGVMRVRV